MLQRTLDVVVGCRYVAVYVVIMDWSFGSGIGARRSYGYPGAVGIVVDR